MKYDDNKIELICHNVGDVSYKKQNKKYELCGSLHLLPCNLEFNEEEIKILINMLLKGSHNLKITIEKE